MADQTSADLVANDSIVSDSATTADHELMIIRENQQMISDNQRLFVD
jgi:hypothetical protein